MKRDKKVKALLLFSGGLDSILAAKVLEQQNIDVTALAFTSYFFDANQALESAQENGIEIMRSDFSKKHLKCVTTPYYGHGSGMNPCIDCHLLMLKEAKKIAKQKGFDLIATGEVLGQRPMSQNERALKIIEKESKLERCILRPLSAKLLPVTEMEETGLVDRDRLQSISGRSRQVQIKLAKELRIKKYPSPAGGCILTEKEYALKLRKLFEEFPKPSGNDLELLRIGRHFWVGKTRIILGRNHEENLRLRKLASKKDILMELKNKPGPLALIRGSKNKEMMSSTQKKIFQYSKIKDNVASEFSFIRC